MEEQRRPARPFRAGVTQLRLAHPLRLSKGGQIHRVHRGIPAYLILKGVPVPWHLFVFPTRLHATHGLLSQSFFRGLGLGFVIFSRGGVSRVFENNYRQDAMIG